MASIDWTHFMQERLPWAVVTHTENISDGAGGMSALIMRAQLLPRASPSGESTPPPAPFPTQVILKCTKVGKEKFETDLGTTREALFYSHTDPLPSVLQACLPTVYYAREECAATPEPIAAIESATTTAALKRKVLIFEDLSLRHGVQAGYFFGETSLHNWGKDLAQLTSHFAPHVTGRVVLMRACELAGALHARFWCDGGLLTGPDARFLRAAQWFRGDGEAMFEATVKAAADAWTRVKASQAETPTVTLDARLVHLLDVTCAQTDFARYTSQWQSPVSAEKDGACAGSAENKVPWTLVHGDYHPANMMVVDPRARSEATACTETAQDFDLVLLDWEVVGVGSGPQELGQFVISHASRAARQAMEPELLQTYRQALRAGGLREAQLPSAEAIRAEYVCGGLGRWCWLFPLCAAACPPKATQFFHDQMLEFMEDHLELAQTITMMRP